MPESLRDLFTRYVAAVAEQDFGVLEQIIHPDFIGEYPQSGERFRGFAAFRAQLERYPGGPRPVALPSVPAKVIGIEERWAITPGYTVLPMAGPERFTTVARAIYPDQSRWWIVSLIELKDNRVYRAETYFAPEFEAPEWRRDIVERYDPSA